MPKGIHDLPLNYGQTYGHEMQFRLHALPGADGQKYIPAGRGFMIDLVNEAAFNSIPHLERRHKLDDGTIINVKQSFGVQVVDIYPATGKVLLDAQVLFSFYDAGVTFIIYRDKDGVIKAKVHPDELYLAGDTAGIIAANGKDISETVFTTSSCFNSDNVSKGDLGGYGTWRDVYYGGELLTNFGYDNVSFTAIVDGYILCAVSTYDYDFSRYERKFLFLKVPEMELSKEAVENGDNYVTRDKWTEFYAILEDWVTEPFPYEIKVSQDGKYLYVYSEYGADYANGAVLRQYSIVVTPEAENIEDRVSMSLTNSTTYAATTTETYVGDPVGSNSGHVVENIDCGSGTLAHRSPDNKINSKKITKSTSGAYLGGWAIKNNMVEKYLYTSDFQDTHDAQNSHTEVEFENTITWFSTATTCDCGKLNAANSSRSNPSGFAWSLNYSSDRWLLAEFIKTQRVGSNKGSYKQAATTPFGESALEDRSWNNVGYQFDHQRDNGNTGVWGGSGTFSVVGSSDSLCSLVQNVSETYAPFPFEKTYDNHGSGGYTYIKWKHGRIEANAQFYQEDSYNSTFDQTGEWPDATTTITGEGTYKAIAVIDGTPYLLHPDFADYTIDILNGDSIRAVSNNCFGTSPWNFKADYVKESDQEWYPGASGYGRVELYLHNSGDFFLGGCVYFFGKAYPYNSSYPKYRWIYDKEKGSLLDANTILQTALDRYNALMGTSASLSSMYEYKYAYDKKLSYAKGVRVLGTIPKYLWDELI